MGPYSESVNSQSTHNPCKLGDVHSKAQRLNTLGQKVDCLETGIMILVKNEIIYKKEGGINPYTTREKSLRYIKCKMQGKENVHSTNYLQDEAMYREKYIKCICLNYK